MGEATHETLAVSTAAVGFAAIPAPAPSLATIRVIAANVRITYDAATTPTTTVGQILKIGEIWRLEGADFVANASFIRDDAVDASLEISYGNSTGKGLSRDGPGHQVDVDGNTVIVGPAAEDAAASGNPLLTGGRFDSTARTLDDGDVGAIALNSSARQIAGIPLGASEVISTSASSDALVNEPPERIGSHLRHTLATPNAGKKIRIIQIKAWTVSASAHRAEFYFDTGANIQSDKTKIIGSQVMDADGGGGPNMLLNFPDGGGPIGAADDVVSVRTHIDVTTSSEFEVLYREE